MDCLCGEKVYTKTNSEYYKVTPAGETIKADGNLEIATCGQCGIARQANPPYENSSDARDFYSKYQPVSSEYQVKSYDHDRDLAKKRCNRYGITTGCEDRILDVGAGSGAFVDECRARGATAFGCEIAQYANLKDKSFIYEKDFLSINFPTDHFKLVTCHDVIEHVVFPKEFVSELFRVTAQGGRCIIDIPNYHVSEGQHHWKKEHLWFFTVKQLRTLLIDAGFRIERIKKPIPSKIVLYCSKPSQKRPTIMLPPGFGDSFWSITKLQSFLKHKGLGIPDIYIACQKDLKHNGHSRSFPFLEMFPFLNVTGEVRHANGPNKAIWTEAYARQGRTVFEGVLGCDYFISYNGHLRVGKKMESIDPHLETNWRPPLFVSLEQENFRKYCQEKYGRYIVFYFPHYGTFVHWARQFPIARVAEYINLVSQKTGCLPIFTGAKWDNEDDGLRRIISQTTNYVDLTGKTSVQKLFGLMHGAEMVVGYPSGLTILSATFNVKTLIIWNDYYNRQFAWHCAPDDVKNKTYFIENTKDLTPRSLTNLTRNIIENKHINHRQVVIDHDNPKLNPPDRLPPQVARVKRVKVPTSNINNPAIKCSAGELISKPELTIACVLKTGDVFDNKYVHNLRNMVNRNIGLNHRFIALSDSQNLDVEHIEFLNDLPGWWSKLELFRLNGPVLYFDLDTVIMDDFSDLAKSVSKMKSGEFRMLIPFNPARARANNWASGVMAWHGDYRFILDRFKYRKNGKGWDQVYIFRTLEDEGVRIKAINEFMPMYSYKRHCTTGVPKGAKIICFHGPNKPHNMGHVDIVKRHWK